MRFMMLRISKGYERAEPGFTPDSRAMEAMTKYNDSMRKAGVMITGDGLHPPSAGAQVTFKGGKPTVSEGPFGASANMLTAGVLLDFAIKRLTSLKILANL